MTSHMVSPALEKRGFPRKVTAREVGTCGCLVTLVTGICAGPEDGGEGRLRARGPRFYRLGFKVAFMRSFTPWRPGAVSDVH